MGAAIGRFICCARQITRACKGRRRPVRLVSPIPPSQTCHTFLLEAAFPLRHRRRARTPAGVPSRDKSHPIGQRQNQSRSENIIRRQRPRLRPTLQLVSLFSIDLQPSLLINPS
jgi:hypothetical protein